MNEEKWYSIKEMSEKTGIPHQTLRRYLDAHSYYLKTRKEHKSVYISSDCVEMIETIRNLYGQGKKAQEVDETIRTMGATVTITIEDENEQKLVPVNEVILHLTQEIQQQKAATEQLVLALQQQAATTSHLLEKQQEQLEQQQKYIDERMESRDQKLMQMMNEMMEQKKKSKGWFSWFRK